MLVRASLVALALLAVASSARAEDTATIAPGAWQIVKRESGPVNYYAVTSDTDPQHPFLRATYRPGLKTAVLGFQLAEADRRRVTKVRWSWRAITLPNGGDECVSGRGDSAAVVYLTWKRMFRYYTLKYVWSAVGQQGRTCDTKRNPFVAQDTVILESGGPLGVWKAEELDLGAEFRRHFEGGNPNAELPDFVGIGLMTDGDQTNSASAADYGPFTLVR